MVERNGSEPAIPPGRWPEVLAVFLKLGLTSFGGPVAHIGYFREEFVARKRWLDERSFVDLVALCQFLPGPASSQVGIGVGLLRAGVPGAFAAWCGFTLPSALALVIFAYGVGALESALGGGWLHGLKIAAVAVVAQAVWGMAQTLCPDRARATLAVLAAVVVLIVPTAWGQIGAIAAGAAIGLLILKRDSAMSGSALAVPIGRGFAWVCLGLFFGLLAGLPLLAAAIPSQTLALADSFYRTGSLVFGGGHVVLPLLQAEVVPPGWVTNDAFLAGYGAAQAVPGPLFTFAAYLGAVDGAAAERMGGRGDLPGRGLSAVVPAGVRGAAVLGGAARRSARAGGLARRQRRRRRPAAGGALSAGMDQRDRGAD